MTDHDNDSDARADLSARVSAEDDTLYRGPDGKERLARDAATMQAIKHLYRDDEAPSLFDDGPIARASRYRTRKEREHQQLDRYYELMGRPPLHADKDREALQQAPKRARASAAATADGERTHGAQFTPVLLATIRADWHAGHERVFDPFAGLGQRLGSWCDEHGLVYAGIDIEDWPGHDERVLVGDAAVGASYPLGRWLIVTSPTYGNGINDHFTPKDPKRQDNTYRTWLGRDLDERNTGRYTVRHGGWKERQYWRINRLAVAIWAERGFDVLVNVKDFPYSGGTYPLVERWAELLAEHGYVVHDRLEVRTPGIRNGTNTDTVADHEVWLRASAADTEEQP